MAHPAYNVPTTIIILGGTGDLAQKKLLPALLDLRIKGFLPDTTRIVGFARRPLSDDDYRSFIRDAIVRKGHGHPPIVIEEFLSHVTYQSGVFDAPDDYRALKEKILAVDSAVGMCTNKIIYLAVPPAFYSVIFDNLSASSIANLCSGEGSWTRILVEKPFGRDLATAIELDETLGKLFREEQIFRIDHYLAKETLQNILMFRFSNSLFEPMWNRDHVERVDIRFHEEGGVGTRGAFYDGVGALRDVGQNHLLQMLALVAMEHPGTLDAAAIRPRRAEIFRQLRGVTSEDLATRVRRRQYREYREEANVAPDSETETYFSVTAYLDSPRWNGVPFILEGGKGMPEGKIEIVVQFKESLPCLCPATGPHHHRNTLTFRIQPDEGISVKFWAKSPGFELALEPKMLSFSYHMGDDVRVLPDAYERVLFDCIRGDQGLFASTEEVRSSWGFITPILELWKELPLEPYGDAILDVSPEVLVQQDRK